MSSDVNLTAAEIADLAGVSRAAVSNWRRRYEDFPAPVSVSPGGGDLFRLEEVESWLGEHRRSRGTVGPEQSVWHALSSARGQVSVELLVQVACSFLGLLKVAEAGQVQRLAATRTPAQLRALVAGMALQVQDRQEAELFGLLTQPTESWDALLWALWQWARTAQDLAPIFEAVLARRERLRVYRGVEAETSGSLVQLVIDLARPFQTLLDPAVGEAGFLVRAGTATSSAARPMHLAGQEVNDDTWRVAVLRCLVHDIAADIRHGDSFSEDLFPDLCADVVVCDPGSGTDLRTAAAVAHRTMRGYSLSSSPTSDLAWVNIVEKHLTADGRGYLILPPTSLHSRRDASGRHELARLGYIEAVVTLPAAVARGSGSGVSLWVVRRPAADSPPPVLFINAVTVDPGTDVVRALVRMLRSELERFRRAPFAYKPEPGLTATVGIIDLLAPDATLLPAHWVRTAVPESQLVERVQASSQAIARAREAFRVAIAFPRISFGTLDRLRIMRRVREMVDAGAIKLIRGRSIPPTATGSKGVPILVAPWERSAPDYARFVLRRAGSSLPITQAGDVAVAIRNSQIRAFVDEGGGKVVPLSMTVLRCVDDSIDPIVFAGLLSAPSNARFVAGISRPLVGLLEVEVPELTLGETTALRDVLASLDMQVELARDYIRTIAELRGNVVDGIVGGGITLSQSDGTQS